MSDQPRSRPAPLGQKATAIPLTLGEADRLLRSRRVVTIERGAGAKWTGKVVGVVHHPAVILETESGQVTLTIEGATVTNCEHLHCVTSTDAGAPIVCCGCGETVGHNTLGER
jgi:hypothetical protein